MSKTIKINGIDFTSYFTPVGYKVGHKKIKGPNEGYMLDGSFTEDVLAIKAVITCTCMPLTETQLNTLLEQLYSGNLSVYFFDTQSGGYRTANMMCDPPEGVDRGTGTNATEYWTGMVLAFTEK